MQRAWRFCLVAAVSCSLGLFGCEDDPEDDDYLMNLPDAAQAGSGGAGNAGSGGAGQGSLDAAISDGGSEDGGEDDAG
jgi:hypothetical protein